MRKIGPFSSGRSFYGSKKLKMSVKIEDGKAGKQVPSIMDLQRREFEEKPEVKDNLDSYAEVGEEPWNPAENGHPLQAVGVLSAEKQDTHDDVPNSVPCGDESEVEMAEPLKLDVQQLNAPRSDLENSNLKRLYLLDLNGEGSNSRTKEEQSLFLKELEKFFRERSMAFKPPKLKGKGVNYLKLWRAVMRRGGYDKVTSGKLWGQVGKSLRPPKKAYKAGSWTCRSFYEKVLLDFEREKLLAGELRVPASSTVEPFRNENQAGSNVSIPVVQSDSENQVGSDVGIPVVQSDNENQVGSNVGIPVVQNDNENQVGSNVGIPVVQSDNENQVCSSVGMPIAQSDNENQVCSNIGIPVAQSDNENQVCSSIGIPVAQSNNKSPAFVSGRTPRHAAAQARLRWHSKCSLGNGEVSIPVVKEKRASSAQKRENCTESSLKRKNRVEEDAVSTIQQETSESRGDIAAVDVGLPTDEAKEDEQKTVSSPEFASAAQLKEAAEKALVVLQTQEQTLSMDTLDMLAPHLKVLMSSSAPIEVALTCKRFEMVMTDQLSTFVEAKRRKIALEEEIESARESLDSTSRCRESLLRSSSDRKKRLAGLEDRKHELEREISCLASERARVETEIEDAKDTLRLIDDVADMERGRSIARDRLIKEMALAEMSTCQGEAALSSLKTILIDAVKKAWVGMKFN